MLQDCHSSSQQTGYSSWKVGVERLTETGKKRQRWWRQFCYAQLQCSTDEFDSFGTSVSQSMIVNMQGLMLRSLSCC